MVVGIAMAGVGVLAPGASAWPNETERCADSLSVTWGADADATVLNVAPLVNGGTVSFSDGTITVTLSNAKPVAGGYWLDEYHIGSVDFTTDKPIDSATLHLWQSSGDYKLVTDTYVPPVTSGVLATAAGSISGLGGQAPFKGIDICYQVEAEVIPTSSVAPTTTVVTSTTAVAPTTVVSPTSEVPTTVPADVIDETVDEGPSVEVLPHTEVAVEVLAQVETAPQGEQLAFTGSSSGTLVTVGTVMVAAGLALTGFDRISSLRRHRRSG